MSVTETQEQANLTYTQAQTRLMAARAHALEEENTLLFGCKTDVETDSVGPSLGEPDTLDIGEAVEEMRHGHRVSRRDWNGPGQFPRIQLVGPFSKMSLPYICISTVRGDLVPWLASQTDILAEDWYVVSL